MRSWKVLSFMFVLVTVWRVKADDGGVDDGGVDVDGFGEARKKKDKYLLTLILGGLIVKAIIFPLAFKFMAVMSSIAVMLSTMSLIVSSIVGYAKVVLRPVHPPVKVVHWNEPFFWAKDDYGNTIEEHPQLPSEHLYEHRRLWID